MYLRPPRFTFSGDFAADTSTVNNDVRHYDNASFQARYQQPAEGDSENGWWNPEGGATFDLLGCSVRSTAYLDGTVAFEAREDWAIGAVVGGSVDRASAKLVDIDPQAQMYSQLWALTLRLEDPRGALLVQGEFEPAGFRDFQFRQFRGEKPDRKPNDQPFGASWSSVLRRVEWGDSDSRILDELRRTTAEGLLAVHLTSFGYYAVHADGRFGTGRLLGVVGPYLAGEPRTFAGARRLVADQSKGPAKFSFSNFHYDKATARITVDLGGSFPLDDPMGTVADVGLVRLAVAKGPVARTATMEPDGYEVIGDVPYEPRRDWLAVTSGLVSLDVPASAAALLDDHQLVLVSPACDSPTRIIAMEATAGSMVRADQYLVRLDPGHDATVDLYVYRWGEPLSNAEIDLQLASPHQTGGTPPDNPDPDPPSASIPFTNQPASALAFPASLTTGNSGAARLVIEGSDPGNPRGYVDGQLYQIVYGLPDLPRTEQHPLDHVVIHLRDAFPIPDRPRFEDIRETLTQFGNLYPVMSRHIADFSDPRQLLAHRDILLHAFKREIDEPDHMPVTRDLSAAKRAAIIRWLEQGGDPTEAAFDSRAPKASTPQPTQPDASEFERPPAIVMSRPLYEAMSEGKGGKSDALRGAKDSIHLVDED